MRRKLKDKVLLLAGMGLTNKQISERLDCHPCYVSATRARAKRKNAINNELKFLSEAIKILEATKPLELR